MNAEFARRGVDAVAVSADVTPGDLGGFARRGYWTRRPPGAASRIRACPCWPTRSTWSWTSSGPAGRASSMIANDFSLARLKTFRDHAKAAVSERNSRDREGSGTRSRTKSFAIMEREDGGLLRACTWDYMASICVTVNIMCRVRHQQGLIFCL